MKEDETTVYIVLILHLMQWIPVPIKWPSYVDTDGDDVVQSCCQVFTTNPVTQLYIKSYEMHPLLPQ